MSAVLQTLLNAVTSGGAGTEHDLSAVNGYEGGSHSVEVSGISGDTVEIEGQIDSTWHSLGSITADGLYTYQGVFKQIRGNVTSYGAGTITAKVRYGVLDTDVVTNQSTLLGRLTSPRATLLDNLSRLDTTISSISVVANVTNIVKEIRKMGAQIAK